MTEETGTVATNIHTEDILETEFMIWDGVRETGAGDGYVQVRVHHLVTGTTGGRAVGRPGELMFAATIRADGCADYKFQTLHICEHGDLIRHMLLLGHTFGKAFDLMGCEPPPTDPGGIAAVRQWKAERDGALFQAAVDDAIAQSKLQTIGAAS